MSEKINELIKSVKDLKYDSSTGTFETDRRALFEFAELIIRECMFQIKEEHNLKSNGTEPVGPYAHGFDDGMFVAINTIKKHFGVEQ